MDEKMGEGGSISYTITARVVGEAVGVDMMVNCVTICMAS